MLGRLPTGPDAIAYRNTLFRVSELCWIKAVRLSIPEHIIRVAALCLGIAWVMTMKSSKGTYANVEFLLAGFPLVLAWSMSGSLKIGCSGDFEETYEQRHGFRSSVFRSWIDALRSREPGWIHLKGSSYDMLFNPNRMAWIRPCILWQFYPLVVGAVYAGYLWLVRKNFDLSTYPVLSDFQVLSFENGRGSVDTLCYAILGTAIAAFLFSLKRGVEICGTGGVQDTFPMSGADQQQLLKAMAGASGTRPAAPAKAAPVPAKAAPAPTPKAPEKKPAPVKVAPPAETQTKALASSSPGETKTAALPSTEEN